MKRAVKFSHVNVFFFFGSEKKEYKANFDQSSQINVFLMWLFFFSREKKK